MSEYAHLFLLRERLKRIRKARRIATILSSVIAGIVAIIVLQYWNDFVTVFVIFGAIGILFILTVSHHYDIKEAQVLWKMEQIAKGEHTD